MFGKLEQQYRAELKGLVSEEGKLSEEVSVERLRSFYLEGLLWAHRCETIGRHMVLCILIFVFVLPFSAFVMGATFPKWLTFPIIVALVFFGGAMLVVDDRRRRYERVCARLKRAIDAREKPDEAAETPAES